MNVSQCAGVVAVLIPAAIIGSVVGGLAAGVAARGVTALASACDTDEETAASMGNTAAGVVGIGSGMWVAGKIIGTVFDSLAD